ncbi:tyrosine-type recombinase/integrase [Mangrovicoccus sp. HB161399]|uniref:tyrosine-type recombinase/integrase n=1 Tax=Mangrovicoccus sp. HB161399 TaxID=2720392 RepID=UPI0020A62669|nr:tyrosine-type recombinase/integrase [Mangrovicoccus sp. HB161399]
MQEDERTPPLAAPTKALEQLAEAAQDYARAAASENTLRAYAQDWADFSRWCRLRGAPALPPSPELVGLYLTERAGTLTVSSLERRLAGISWGYRQRGMVLDRGDRHIVTVMKGIRRRHARPPVQKAPLSAEELLAMAATLPRDLRGFRDRAMLLLGFAGALRRSELTGLDLNREDTGDGAGWVETEEQGALLILRGKTGWREVEVGRGSTERSCPVAALERWLELARISHGPLFRRVSRDGRRAMDGRLNDRHVARLVKSAALAAGLRPELGEAERAALFSGHSLRAGLASHADAADRDIQRQLGHASLEMTRRYQRKRDRFRVNLTKAAGL